MCPSPLSYRIGWTRQDPVVLLFISVFEPQLITVFMRPEYPKAAELIHKDMDAIACRIAALERDDPRRPELI